MRETYKGGITESQLLASVPQQTALLRTESDLSNYATFENGGWQLEDYKYQSDVNLLVINNPLFPVKLLPSFDSIKVSWFIHGQISYTGAGAMYRNNPDAEQHSALVLDKMTLFGNGANTLFDLRDIFAIGILTSATIDNFAGYYLKNILDTILNGQRFVNPQGPAIFEDPGQCNITGDIHECTTAIPYIYELRGTSDVFKISSGQALIKNATTKVIKIDPHFKGQLQINNYGIRATAGSETGRLYGTDLSSITGIAQNNGGGFVRVNDATPHGLTDGESIFVKGANDYSEKEGGYRIKNIDANNFDLLLDRGIIAITDGGGGLLDITTELQHRLSNGDSVVVTSATYNGTYTVSGVDPLTPYLFNVTDTYSIDSSGVYEKFTPFTAAGDNFEWYNESINESNLFSQNNGLEVNSRSSVVFSMVGVGVTAINPTTWTKIAALASLQRDGEQRWTVFNNGGIRNDSSKSTSNQILGEFYGEVSSGTDQQVIISYLVDNEAAPRVGVAKANVSLKNTPRGRSVNALIKTSRGESIYLAAKTEAGTYNLTLSEFTGSIF